MEEPTTVITEEPTTEPTATDSIFGGIGAFFQGIIDIILKIMDAVKQIVEGAKSKE